MHSRKIVKEVCNVLLAKSLLCGCAAYHGFGLNYWGSDCPWQAVKVQM